MTGAEQHVVDALRSGPTVQTPAYLAWRAAQRDLEAAAGTDRAEAVEGAVWSFIAAVEDADSIAVRLRHDEIVAELSAANLPEGLEDRWYTALEAVEREHAELGRRQRAAAAVAVAMATPNGDSAGITLPPEVRAVGRRLVAEGLDLDRRLAKWLNAWHELNTALAVLAVGDVPNDEHVECGAGIDVPDEAYTAAGADVLLEVAMRMQRRVIDATGCQEHDTLAEHDAGVARVIAAWEATDVTPGGPRRWEGRGRS